MRRLTSIVLAGVLSASSAFAADTAPLSNGKPAGVKQAELAGGNGLLLVFGLAIVAGGIALVASEGSGNGITNSTTATTTTTTTTATSSTATTG